MPTSTNQLHQTSGGKAFHVETFNSFSVNQVQTFDILLLNNSLAINDFSISISNPVLGLLERQIEQINVQQSKCCRVSFVAPLVGIYSIKVQFNGNSQLTQQLIQFQAKAYDLSKVFINTTTDKCRLLESFEFSVDASEAGEGQLEIAVNEGEIPNQVQVLDNGKCIVNFIPEDCVQHIVDIKFNGHNVNGCPFVVQVYENDQQVPNKQKIIAEPALIKEDRVLVNELADFSFDNIPSLKLNKDDVIILDPENQLIDYNSTNQEQSEKYRFQFRPTIVGDYTVKLKQSSDLYKALPPHIIDKFPFLLKVFDHTKVLVSDVTDGVIGHPIYFFIDASQAGSGNLEIKVSSKTRNVPNYPQSETNAKIRVNFTPTEAVDHTIDIKFNGFQVPGNPFLVKVAQYPQGRLPITSQDVLKYVPFNEFTTFYVEYIGQMYNGKSSVSSSSMIDKSICRAHVLQPSFLYKTLDAVEYKDKKFKFSFKPAEIGPNKLFITVNNELLPSCPITCNVFDINQVKVLFNQLDATTKEPIGQINKPVSFTVDASKAGEGTLALAVVSNSSKNPVQTDVNVSEEGHGLYDLTFTPIERSAHSIDMSFNDRVVPNSPFIVQIYDENNQKSPIHNNDQKQLAQNLEDLHLTASTTTTTSNNAKQTGGSVDKKNLTYGLVNASNIIYLDSNVLDNSGMQVNLLGPNNEQVPFTLAKGSPQAGEPKKPYIEYKPKSIGTHKINVADGDGKFSRQYFIEICDPSSIRLSDINLSDDSSFFVRKPVTFTIDSSRAGSIKLDSITVIGPSASASSSLTNGRKSGNKNRESDQTLLGRLKSISSSTNTSSQNLSAPVEFSLERLSEFKQQIKFIPQLVGKYSIDIRCLGQPIGPCPFEIEVKPLQLYQETNTQQTMTNSKHSREAELLQSIVVHGVSLKSTPVNSTGAFIIETNNLAQARDFDVLITDPSNHLVDVQCYLQQDGNLLAEWTPKIIGPHKIEVLYKDEQVPNSPLTSEAFDPSGVLIENLKTTQYSVNDEIEFVINRKQAGLGKLDLTISSSGNQQLPINIKPLSCEEDGEYCRDLISFKPTVAGKYKLSVTFGGYEIPKSPITFLIRDSHKPKNQLSAKIAGSGLKVAEVNRSALFTIETNQEGELKIRIECGGREIVPKVERRSEDPLSYVVKYKPSEIGYANISIYWNGLHLDKSPYTVPVCDLSRMLFLSGTNKSSNANNQRLINYEARIPKEVTLDTAKCGPGELTAEAYCRANPNLKFSIPTSQYVQNRYKIVFVCPPRLDQVPKGLDIKNFSFDTTYMIRFYFNNLAVPESLASIIASPMLDSRTNIQETIAKESNNNIESSKSNHRSNGVRDNSTTRQQTIVDCPIVALRGHGLVDAKCGERAEFTIDGSEAGFGEPEVKFISSDDSPTGAAEIRVELEKVKDKVYKATYVPQSIGLYSLNVLWDGKQVAGCPISINIIGNCDPSKVICTGDGLKGGVLGEEIKTFIDTRRAGPGELTALCTGPQKVAFCELLDRGDGTFILYVKPQEAGRQFLTIKYGGQHIPKSPFLIRVAGKPDPSKVRVHGPGVEHGVLSLYQSRFVCDTRGAGAGQLTVRIRGPKGAFRMETQRESQKDRTILCKYDPTEPGDYRIEIKWSGKHVPGSPFSVMIFDTQEELNRFLMSEQQSQNPHHHQQMNGKHHLASPGIHQVPYHPTMIEYGQYSNMSPQATNHH